MSNRSHSTIYHFDPTQRSGQAKYRQYQKGCKLGEGGFAACYKATRYSDRKAFAMKVIRLNDRRQLSNSRDRQRVSSHPKLSTVEKARSEAKLLRMCNHERIVKYETDFIYENNFYLVMEYCQRGNLNEMLKKRGTISEVETRYYLRQMIEALQYLKERKIIHRDLKPANYLLTDKLRLKIADFGLATEVVNHQPNLKNMCGTPNFISPELLERGPYSYEVDLWSVGVIMYLMLYGIAPFQTKKKEAQQTYEQIKKCQYKLTDPKVSFQARNLISKILVAKPQQRIKLQDVLKHPFMTNFQIPYQLSARYLRQHPDDRFLEFYQSQKKLQISKQSQHSKRQSLKPQPKNQRNSFQNSFSISQQRSLSLKQKASKKEKKKEKKEDKQSQKQNYYRKKSIAEVIKKFQKQQILTFSPYSQAQSIYKSDKNKWIQNPSYQGNSQLKFARIEKYSKKQNQILLNQRGSTNLKENRSQIEQKNVKKQIQRDELEAFPSFTSMLKDLSFDEMIDQQEQNLLLYNLQFLKPKNNLQRSNFDEPSKKVKLDHKKIKILSRDFHSSKNFNKTNDKGLVSENLSRKYQANELNEKVYILEDFLLFTPSMHSNSNKMMKIIYCLKEQVANLEQKDNDENLLKIRSDVSLNKIIGVIFNDNTSIVTKIIIQNQSIQSKSIYIKNLQVNFTFNKSNKVSFSNLLSNQISQKQTPQSEGFFTENYIDLGFNIFNFDKVIQETQIKNIHKKQQSRNLNILSLNHQISLKIRYSQDANKYFLHLIRQAAINSEYLSNHNRFQKQSRQVLEQDNFVFVKFFSSKRNQQKIFFELNNDTKHFMSLNSNKIHYQSIFKNNQNKQNKPKFHLYKMIIYNSFKKIGYIKQQSGRLKAKKWENLKSLIQEKQNQKDETKVKKYQQDSDQDEVKKDENNIDKNINYQNLIFQLCLSFRDKMEFFYLRQKKLLSKFEDKKQNEKNNHQEIFLKQNNCDFQIKDGRLDVKVHPKQDIDSIMKRKSQIRKI